MIEVRCFHRLVDAEPFRQAINTLNLDSPRPDPFSTFEYYDNYLRQVEQFPAHDNLRPWLLLAFSDGELVGYLALKQRTHRVLGLAAVKLELMTAFMTGRPRLVARAEHTSAVSAALYAYVLGRGGEWSLLEFQQQDADSPLQPMSATIPGWYSLRTWPSPAHGSIALHGRSLSDYFTALPKKSRSNISRQMRSLMAAGELRMLTSSDPLTVQSLFALYRRIESHSWKARAGAGVGRDLRTLGYYSGLMGAGQPMRITIQVLLLNDMPVAGLICGSFERGLYALDIVYDERHATLAPGSAMLLLGVRLAIDSGCEFFDLLWGFGYYKTRWLATMCMTRTLQIYRIGTPYYWRRLLGDLMRRGEEQVTAGDGPTNPARHHAIAASVTSAQLGSVDRPDKSDSTAMATLIAEASRGQGEFLSAVELAARLPFPALARHDMAKDA